MGVFTDMANVDIIYPTLSAEELDAFVDYKVPKVRQGGAVPALPSCPPIVAGVGIPVTGVKTGKMQNALLRMLQLFEDRDAEFRAMYPKESTTNGLVRVKGRLS